MHAFWDGLCCHDSPDPFKAANCNPMSFHSMDLEPALKASLHAGMKRGRLLYSAGLHHKLPSDLSDQPMSIQNLPFWFQTTCHRDVASCCCSTLKTRPAQKLNLHSPSCNLQPC